MSPGVPLMIHFYYKLILSRQYNAHYSFFGIHVEYDFLHSVFSEIKNKMIIILL